MELFILIITIILLAETTYLVAKSAVSRHTKNTGRRKVYVDTSALIDGRLLAVAKTGFISDDLIIPRSVIRELQLLADGKDKDKRNLARRGMDNANDLERVVFCNVTIYQDALDRTPVDERLIALAKENGGLICTNDFNLNKVAATEGIDVLNVNDLALALADGYNSGDHLKVKIVGPGSNPGQGVGHLDDGTMVIVDNAAKNQGKILDVEIVRFIQSSAGRMIFAKKLHRK
ncbi:TRAM domain-containing protein [Candidatus Saccharibacteria bacterium]|nr:TRAM domain-containing protein [Candidatus Saccharibacteria bacterium]